ncbi:MAG: PAS domain-containing protein [Oscillospiraceae bacterium]|nr:PAS domain-containing protein [Oscillospiraceae bacterium]
MELNELFKAVIDADDQPVVICDLSHTIVYMNPTAIMRYHKRGGKDLIGKSLMDCHNERSRGIILSIVENFKSDPSLTKVYTYTRHMEDGDVRNYIVALRNDSGELIGYYEKKEKV